MISGTAYFSYGSILLLEGANMNSVLGCDGSRGTV